MIHKSALRFEHLQASEVVKWYLFKVKEYMKATADFKGENKHRNFSRPFIFSFTVPPARQNHF